MNAASPVTVIPFEPSDETAVQALVRELRGEDAPIHVLIVAADDAPADWSARSVVQIAETLGRGSRPVILADFSVAQPVLHDALGAPGDEGLTDHILFGASLERIETYLPERSFRFLPAGPSCFDAGPVLRSPQLRDLIARYSAQGDTLIAYLPASTTGIGRLVREFGTVFLGSQDAATDWREQWPGGAELRALRPLEHGETVPAPAPETSAAEMAAAPTRAEDAPGATGEAAPPTDADAAGGDAPTFEFEAEASVPVAETEEPESAAEPQSVAEPQSAAEPESTEEPESVAEPQSVAEPESVAEPQSTEEPQSVEEPESAEEPQTADAVVGEIPRTRARWEQAFVKPGAPVRASAASAAGVEDDGHFDDEIPFWRRPPFVGMAVVALLVVAIVSVVVMGGDEEAPSGAAATDGAETTPTAVQPAAPVDVSSLTNLSEPLTHSVAVEAHPDLPTASSRLDALRSAGSSTGFFISPVVVGGATYYRVMAGPVADSARAAVVMDRLIDAGLKSGGSSWDVRWTPYTYLIGEYDARAEADARTSELMGQGIPTYVVDIPYEGGYTRYAVVAGAYQGPVEAGAMGEILRDAGLADSLVERTGRAGS